MMAATKVARVGVGVVAARGVQTGGGAAHMSTAASEHWYHARTGAPCYEVPWATNPALRRPPEIRDARRLALLPSVTTVLGIVNRPGIQYWRMQQFLQAVREVHAQRLPAVFATAAAAGAAAGGAESTSPESLEEAGRESELAFEDVQGGLDDVSWREIQQLYSRKVLQAAEIGSQVHALLEQHIRWRFRASSLADRTPAAWPATFEPMRDAVDQWLDAQVEAVVHVERSFASPYGYGGKVDLVCQMRDGSVGVCDFKTQAARRKFTLHSYWPAQLAGYAVGLGVPTARLLNICLDTINPGTCLIKDWSRPATAPADAAGAAQDANEPYWEAFRLAFLLWCSPLGRQFEPARDVPGCVPMPHWAHVLEDVGRNGARAGVLGPDDGAGDTGYGAGRSAGAV